MRPPRNHSPRRAATASAVRLVLLAAVLGAACSGGDRTSAPPTGPTRPPDTAGTVQRGTLTVTVSIDAADAPIAATIGLEPAAPAGITVTLTALGNATAAPQVAMTDAAGRVTFARLLEGPYAIAVERPVRDAERALLRRDDQEVSGFAGGLSVAIVPGAQSASVALAAGRPGSLVISEVWPYAAPIGSERQSYSYGAFLELYNNGDTTVYLDGVVFGSVPPVSENLSIGGQQGFDVCEIFRGVRDDPTRLPLASTQVFPGSGRDYPVLPGAAVVIAVDAIDHRPFGVGTLDLSDADFESIGDTRDVDNPAVPNVTGLPGTVFLGVEGRGYPVGRFVPDGYVLAKPSSTPLPRLTVDDRIGFGTDLAVVAGDDVLDVAFLDVTPGVRTRTAASGVLRTVCAVRWHPRWERAPAPIVDVDAFRGNRAAFVRRTAYTRPDGRVVLQRTRTSARDWVYGPLPTPGAVR